MNNFKKLVLLTCFSLCSAAFLVAQSSSQQDADALFSANKFQEAALAYQQIVAKEPGNGVAWQSLGESYLRLKKFSEARNAFMQSGQHGYAPLMNRVNVARAYAAEGNSAEAFKALQALAETGKAAGLRGYISSRAEFASLKDTPGYKTLIEALAPCQTGAFHHFDFWIGDWEVQNPAGQKVGDNLVTREQEGCLLVEHWKSAQGVETGTSFNYYDIRDKKWHQIYIANNGNAGAFPAMAGELTDNRMVLITDEKQSPVFRWTWYVLSPGKVRQMAEQSNDGQKTWQTVWDSVYVSKTNAASARAD
ncbi:MAG TPA: tetratricopeptide repeat protein [Candidatus Limnocylindrales bacterium]|jgi:tetratricopeptide (TPR) repeat protein|nr:tetratricopeptide repeat protein [Candidatus Limnocylindrales bacterium]